jgi:hypothetical protein
MANEEKIVPRYGIKVKVATVIVSVDCSNYCLTKFRMLKSMKFLH